MVPALVRKTWRDDRRVHIGWALGIAAFTSIYTGFYGQFRDVARTKQEAMPPEMLDFLGIPDMFSPEGYLQGTVFSLMAPLLVIMCAAVLGSRAIAAPEERGGLELLLANPLSRRSFAAHRLFAVVAGLTAVAAVPWLVLMIVMPAVDMDASLSHVSAACVGLIALGWCFAGIAFLAGAATGRPGHVFAVTGVLGIGTYMANALSGLVEGMDWTRYLSPFHYFIGTDPLHTGWHVPELLLLALVGALAAAAGVVLFDRRDVGV